MKSTSISDVRRMCQRGAFRAYVQGGKVFLEDTATGQVVPLNGESCHAKAEREPAAHRQEQRGSRVERMFGKRDTWQAPTNPDADQGPYKGFLMVQCEECGAIKAFCAKHETYGYKCGECGHETPLEKLRPLFMQPTLDMGQTFSKDRLAPMIRDTPVLRGLVDVKSRYAGNTILKKNFPGGHITIVGANSATGLASRPIKVLLADEVDRYPGSAGTEGDPLSLAQKRQTTFWDKKTVMVSTPVIKGHSRIETEYNQSTREEWNVPCPECGHYQPFVWANLIFDPDDLQKEIVYKCERCGCVANEYRWKQQSQQGRFVAENPGAETRGFHLNTLASTFCGWKEIVQKFIVAKEQLDQGNPEGMKVWVNTELGETWEERGEQVEDTELFNRREIYDAVVPEEVLVLTAGVDVQDDRFEVEIVGWGVGKESWGIRYQKIYGDMLKEQVWEDLDAFLQTVWCKKDGTALRIISCCIDSGGHHTDQVYRFTKERYERGVWAIKGKGGAEVPYIRKPVGRYLMCSPANCKAWPTL